MAVVTVSEYASMKHDKDGNLLPAFDATPIATQSITLSGTSAAVSNAWDSATKFVRIACNGDCHITFADTPTATTSNELFPQGTVEARSIDKETGTKLAAIQAS